MKFSFGYLGTYVRPQQASLLLINHRLIKLGLDARANLGKGLSFKILFRKRCFQKADKIFR